MVHREPSSLSGAYWIAWALKTSGNSSAVCSTSEHAGCDGEWLEGMVEAMPMPV